MYTEQNLPIGSVVVLSSNPEGMVMITGYNIVNDNILYDYAGVPYPLGADFDDQMILFLASAIEKVCFEGCKGNEYPQLVDILKETREKVKESFNASSNSSDSESSPS